MRQLHAFSRSLADFHPTELKSALITRAQVLLIREDDSTLPSRSCKSYSMDPIPLSLIDMNNRVFSGNGAGWNFMRKVTAILLQRYSIEQQRTFRSGGMRQSQREVLLRREARLPPLPGRQSLIPARLLRLTGTIILI